MISALGQICGHNPSTPSIRANLAPVKDSFVFTGLVLGFATLVTVHLALAVRLVLRERPRWRGLVALVVPPLAVIWGFRAGFRRNAVLWLVAVVVYLIALIVSLI